MSQSRIFYHGSPIVGLTELRQGSFVSPDPDIARLMGRFHQDTGKTWTDDDLKEPLRFGDAPNWKLGREPLGIPVVYVVIVSNTKLDLLNNPYEHKLLQEEKIKTCLKESHD